MAHQGIAYDTITAVLQVSKAFISKWKSIYAEQGVAGFQMGYRGSAGYLTTEQHDHARRATCRTCQARLQEAVALYRGEFLTGFFLEDCLEFDEWLLMWRERLPKSRLG
jgi:transposase